MRTLTALLTAGALSLVATPALARPTSGYTPHAHPAYGYSIPAAGTLVVRNDGDLPLLVSFGHSRGPAPADLWLAPGTAQYLQVRAGDVSVTASIGGRNGLRVVESSAVRVAPGSRSVQAFGWYLPDPVTPVTFTNTAWRPVQVLVDGRTVAYVAPGQTTRFDVDAGRHGLRVQSGHFVVYDQVTTFRDGLALGATVVPGGGVALDWSRLGPRSGGWSGRGTPVAYAPPPPAHGPPPVGPPPRSAPPGAPSRDGRGRGNGR